MIRRATRQREAILNVLRATDTHPTADWIYDEVRKTIPGLSKGTVYRNLKILQEAGEISELNISGTVSRFEGGRRTTTTFDATGVAGCLTWTNR